MSDLPILFSAPMVRALLDGRKTQTRRILTRHNCTVLGEKWGKKAPWEGLRFGEAWPRANSPISGQPLPHLAVPFCHPADEPQLTEDCGVYRIYPIIEAGDRLWVRESLKAHAIGLEFAAALGVGDAPPERVDMARHDLCVAYAADDEPCVEEHGFDLSWLWKRPTLPSIHMPRQLSRLTLTVTDVRVQRLQEISEEDAKAEGAPWYVGGHDVISDEEYRADPGYQPSKRAGFECLWREIHGPDAWAENPWIVALTFTVHRCKIDALANPQDPSP